jgi:copper(I)-binding protein
MTFDLSLRRRLVAAGIGAALALSAATAAFAHEVKVGDLVLHHPWTRATPNAAKVGGAYMEIENTGAEPDRLLGGSVPFAERVEVHEMAVVDGVMTMRQLPDGIEIPAGGTLVLKPGSFHLMFMGMEQPLMVDTVVEGKLVFEKAGEVTVEFAVQDMGAKAPEGAGHESMDHSDHAN